MSFIRLCNSFESNVVTDSELLILIKHRLKKTEALCGSKRRSASVFEIAWIWHERGVGDVVDLALVEAASVELRQKAKQYC